MLWEGMHFLCNGPPKGRPKPAKHVSSNRKEVRFLHGQTIGPFLEEWKKQLHSQRIVFCFFLYGWTNTRLCVRSGIGKSSESGHNVRRVRSDAWPVANDDPFLPQKTDSTYWHCQVDVTGQISALRRPTSARFGEPGSRVDPMRVKHVFSPKMMDQICD